MRLIAIEVAATSLNPKYIIKRKKLNNGYIWTVWDKGIPIAEMSILLVSSKKNIWTTSNIEIDEDYRRQGIATHLYSLVREFLKKKKATLVKSNNVTSEGEKLWKSGKI